MTAHVDLYKAGTLAANPAVSVEILAPVARFSLRAGPSEQASLSKALGITLPVKIGQRSSKGEVEILCLGPDEWVLLAPDNRAAELRESCQQVYDTAPHSLTDISDRDISLKISGPKATDLVTIGCPRDPDMLPVGEGRRTVFDGIAVVLWRDEAQEYRLDLWPSFAPHVISLLQSGCAELARE